MLNKILMILIALVFLVLLILIFVLLIKKRKTEKNATKTIQTVLNAQRKSDEKKNNLHNGDSQSNFDSSLAILQEYSERK